MALKTDVVDRVKIESVEILKMLGNMKQSKGLLL